MSVETNQELFNSVVSILVLFLVTIIIAVSIFRIMERRPRMSNLKFVDLLICLFVCLFIYLLFS